jgi:DNA-binding CsgD family transcriptional regulator
LRLLSPHVRRAISITDLVEMRTLRADAAEDALESIAVAVVMVDGAGRIVFANEAAASLLAASDPIRSDLGILVARDPAAAQALAVALAKTREPEAEMGNVGIDIPMPFADGRPGLAHVLPIGSSKVRGALSSTATAAVFLTPPGSPVRLPDQALAATFGFTPMELRILELLVCGQTITEAGATLGIAPTTARTHLARIMDKTGTERQVDLVQLVTGLTPPVLRRETD